MQYSVPRFISSSTAFFFWQKRLICLLWTMTKRLQFLLYVLKLCLGTILQIVLRSIYDTFLVNICVHLLGPASGVNQLVQRRRKSSFVLSNPLRCMDRTYKSRIISDQLECQTVGIGPQIACLCSKTRKIMVWYRNRLYQSCQKVTSWNKTVGLRRN